MVAAVAATAGAAINATVVVTVNVAARGKMINVIVRGVDVRGRRSRL